MYCFARKTHSYLDLDTGLGFDSQIVVKTNAPDLLRRELGGPRWRGGHIAMGTNVDCYQRAEGRYRLMPGIIEALRDHANPFSILTKGTLILRDLDLLTEAAAVTDVGISVSVGFTDRELWRTVEPGTPAPERRLDVIRALAERGIDCGVLMAPVIPYLGDHPDQLRATVRAIAEAAPPRSPRSSSTCVPAPASGTSSGSPHTTPTWSPTTNASTPPAPTPPRATSAASRARSTNWPASTASDRPARGRRGGYGRSGRTCRRGRSRSS
ncbi:radical SAM protein [Actinomadura keratinilytica]